VTKRERGGFKDSKRGRRKGNVASETPNLMHQKPTKGKKRKPESPPRKGRRPYDCLGFLRKKEYGEALGMAKRERKKRGREGEEGARFLGGDRPIR